MDINEAQGGQIEKCAGKDLSIGDDDGEVGGRGAEGLEERGVATAIGLFEGKTEVEGPRFDWRRMKMKAASGGSVGLGDDPDDLEERVRGESVEAGAGQRGGAEEGDAELVHGGDAELRGSARPGRG
jgi:hypothetical protein